MTQPNSVVGIFADHVAAEDAVKKLAAAGLSMKTISVVGKGYHTDEQVMGFYNAGDRVKFWGLRGAFWGALWGLLFGGIFLTLPVTGPVFILGYLGIAAVTALETGVVVGGVSALSAALYSIGIPHDSVVQYEADVQADDFLVVVQGSTADIEKARDVLGTAGARSVQAHEAAVVTSPPAVPVTAEPIHA